MVGSRLKPQERDLRDDADCIGHPREVSKAYHWEAGMVSGRWDLGDIDAGGIPTGSGDAIGGKVHWPSKGEGSEVSGPTPTTGVICEGNRIQGRGSEAKAVVEAGND